MSAGLRRPGRELLIEARKLGTAAFLKPADGKIFEPKVYRTGADLPTDEHVDAPVPVLRSGIMDFRLEVIGAVGLGSANELRYPGDSSTLQLTEKGGTVCLSGARSTDWSGIGAGR